MPRRTARPGLLDRGASPGGPGKAPGLAPRSNGAYGAHARPGLTLIEVLLALAILLLSLAAIGQLVDIGGNHGLQARFHVIGTRLAQAKLAECEAGVIPISGGGGTFDDEPGWSWDVSSQPETATNLYRVTATVSRDDRGRRFEIVLSQLVYDPAMTGSAAQAQKPTQADVDSAEVNGGTGMPPTEAMP
jgi:prepilin-type N-terminal cleavage/methylation domain-containing protein